MALDAGLYQKSRAREIGVGMPARGYLEVHGIGVFRAVVIAFNLLLNIKRF